MRHACREARIPTAPLAPALPCPSCSKSRPLSISDWNMAKLQKVSSCSHCWLSLGPSSPTRFPSTLLLLLSRQAMPASSIHCLSLLPCVLQGVNTSLPSLLHPSAAFGTPHTIDASNVSLTLKCADPRTSKVFTIPEFTLAFSIYCDVIHSAFPSRHQELDDYLSIILNFAIQFGGSGFYNYHHLFLASTSACL
ncbi:hypothetical protein SRHO_G00180350 [Serrasalmus rhombeus]